MKDIFGPMFEAMLQGEMNSHLGYSNNERGEKETLNRRNGYSKKTLKTTAGDVPIEVLHIAKLNSRIPFLNSRIPSAFGKYLDSIVDRRVMAGCHHQAIR